MSHSYGLKRSDDHLSMVGPAQLVGACTICCEEEHSINKIEKLTELQSKMGLKSSLKSAMGIAVLALAILSPCHGKLQITTVNKGDCTRGVAKNGERVTVHYVGTLEDGKKCALS